uniref:DUF1653 domain-containing protein n=1 Tax=Eubacterium plexicaudatum ASF492 TaxID=1235802 RepID=N1ZYG0_9FIRM
MMEWIPKTGERYKDDANKLYQIIAVAVHAETAEQIVVYQEMFGDFGIYALDVRQITEKYGWQRVFTTTDRSEPMQVERKCASVAGSGQGNSLAANTKPELRPRTQSPAESRRAMRQSVSEASGEGTYYYEKRRRQMEEREQRRELFRKSERHESATEELRANPCLIKFLEADTYEEKFHVLNEIQNDITDRLIDDIAVVLDVVIPEGALADRFHQLRNIILTRQKYETNRFR